MTRTRSLPAPLSPRAALVCVIFCTAFPLFSQEWYLSNSSGLALEKSPSSLMALHSEWSVSVAEKAPGDLPRIIAPFYKDSFSIELRVLYQRGKPARRQWLFRDEKGLVRLNGSFPDGKNAEDGRLPFVELYSEENYLRELYEYFSEEERFITRYRYQDGLLLASETEDGKGKKLWNDIYKYTREAKLRGVERRYAEADEREYVRHRFPMPGDFIGPESPHNLALRGGALRNVFDIDPVKILYYTDEKGRVTREERMDGEGSLIASVDHEWSGDRLMVIRWKAGDNSGLVEYEYSSSGERIGEKNYRNGFLERSVTLSGTRETEELFMNGKLMLRAVWENGRKISEERL